MATRRDAPAARKAAKVVARKAASRRTAAKGSAKRSANTAPPKPAKSAGAATAGPGVTTTKAATKPVAPSFSEPAKAAHVAAQVAGPARTVAPEQFMADMAQLPTQGWMEMWQDLAKATTSAPQLPQLRAMSLSPERLMQLQADYTKQVTALWTDFFEHPDRITQPIGDNRFADPTWQHSSMASMLARAYLLNAETMRKMAEAVQADSKTKKRVRFSVDQWVQASAPSNFLALNPKAQQTLLESGGESLKQGIHNLLTDLQKGKISQTDEAAFEVGRNVATSEGAVVFENALMQLIQYKPLTAKVYERPFVMVPPCINKYYILDLQPQNSFIRYCVEQGHTVFVVSWKNPHEPEAHMTWDDYLELGPIAALEVAREICGADRVNALGFCVGGTIVAAALAVMYARGESPIASLTMLTALLDFEDTGVMDAFVDEQHVRMRERTLGKGGLMSGKDLANTFSSLRPNDLVWNYVVSNYLEGKQPPPFDLLYWNGDSTNLPGPMYAWYLRNTYLENKLKQPNALKCCGQSIDLQRIKVPTYVFAAREDHIVPWQAAYASARVLPGSNGKDVRFVLGASGHIAGTINAPAKNKRNYWVTDNEALPPQPDAWFGVAKEVPGSWWPDFSRWLAGFGGAQKAAPKTYGNAKYKVIEPAPGRYVKEKA
jgi:polyhydroxyalkanoate synthase